MTLHHLSIKQEALRRGMELMVSGTFESDVQADEQVTLPVRFVPDVPAAGKEPAQLANAIQVPVVFLR